MAAYAPDHALPMRRADCSVPGNIRRGAPPHMSVRGPISAAVLLALTIIGAGTTLGPAAATAPARTLSVVVQDPDQQAAWQAVFAAPFSAATGFGVSTGTWSGGVAALTQQVKSQDTAWNLVLLGSEDLVAACAGGLLEKLDWAQIGGREHYMPVALSECGVGETVANLVLAWDRSKLPGSPNWADFWDVTKFPGKRGLHKGVRGILEIALMADGVAPGDVYKTLSSAEGVDRAFRKLDQLRPYIVWWDSAADAAKILASGDVLMTSAPSPEIVALARAQQRDLGMQWTGSLYDVLSLAVPKGSPDQRVAQQFLYFSGTPAIEAKLLLPYGLNGFAKGANDDLPPELTAISPTAPANLAAGLRVDAAFWQANLPKLRQRFEAWLGQQR